ncbi:MAG: ArsC/Spx/MgsR family protein [Cyanobacteriota bacterium]|nr:ArsC/Spx/MgsR family protein [Cyanobacteriota bacterium]
MATIFFYEKPGCINNTRQKALLEAAGHQIIARNLLTQPWTPWELQRFFGQRPVAEWFNRTAPQIKSGEVVPEQLDSQNALQLMVENPLLIRRPLIQVCDRYEIGFDVDEIEAWIGLTPKGDRNERVCEHLKQQDLQTCPQHG